MSDTVEVTPEPMVVVISAAVCPSHSFNYVSMPRDAGGDARGFLFKCPIRDCGKGVTALTGTNF
jgi:hypothetical protein